MADIACCGFSKFVTLRRMWNLQIRLYAGPLVLGWIIYFLIHCAKSLKYLNEVSECPHVSGTFYYVGLFVSANFVLMNLNVILWWTSLLGKQLCTGYLQICETLKSLCVRVYASHVLQCWSYQLTVLCRVRSLVEGITRRRGPARWKWVHALLPPCGAPSSGNALDQGPSRFRL
jgi:hypothetical protein